MISNDELQLRILAELEEAGEDNLVALLNTINEEKQGRREEVAHFRTAMEQLIDKGLVLMAPEREPGKHLVEVDETQSHAMLAEIMELLFFHADDLHWTLNPFIYTYAVLTADGRVASEKVLGERGYQWWYHEQGSDP